jgi:hypothetical protein
MKRNNKEFQKGKRKMKKQKYKIYLDESGQIACQRKRPRSIITTLKRILKGK